MSQIFAQDDHNTIARKFAELVQKNNPDTLRVQINADDKTVIGSEPDVAIYDLNDKLTLAVEIETMDTLSDEQALQRWKPIADKAPSFQIVLPKGTLARVKRICKRNGIKAKFQVY